MRYSIIATALAAAVSAITPALADDCQTVADAYDALGKVQAYREIITLDGKLLMEVIAAGDTLFRKDENGWKSMNLGPGGRAQMQKKVIPDAASLKGCAYVGTDTVDGKDAVMYDYTPSVKGVGELGPQRVWIGNANGLPLRMKSEQGKTDIMLSFDNVTAPAQ